LRLFLGITSRLHSLLFEDEVLISFTLGKPWDCGGGGFEGTTVGCFRQGGGAGGAEAGVEDECKEGGYLFWTYVFFFFFLHCSGIWVWVVANGV
jgi:hypothetical protein